jgi:hypothetical protein
MAVVLCLVWWHGQRVAEIAAKLVQASARVVIGRQGAFWP